MGTCFDTHARSLARRDHPVAFDDAKYRPSLTMSATDNAAQFDAAMQPAWQGSMLHIPHSNDIMASGTSISLLDNTDTNADLWSDSYLQAASNAMLQQHAAARFAEGAQLQNFKQAPEEQIMPTGLENMVWSQLSTSPQQLSHAWPSSQHEGLSNEIKSDIKAGSYDEGTSIPSRLVDTIQRSQTETLWQRRLNAKNRELQQLHQRMSAPEVSPQSNSPLFFRQRRHESEDAAAGASRPESETSFTSASSSASEVAGFPHSLGLTDMPSCVEQHPALWDAPSRLAYRNPFTDKSTANSQQAPNAHYDHERSLRVATRNAPSLEDGGHIPTSPQRSITRKNGSKSRRLSAPSHEEAPQMTRGSENADASSFSQQQPGVRSRSHSNSSQCSDATVDHSVGISCKGTIDKVIVPSAPGAAQSDAVDINNGEAGQMRHVCPYEGCAKHFSTSGHARRHSRIHDCLRPFVCPHDDCHATFTRRDNCTQHQRARHKFQLVAHRLEGGNTK